MSVEWPAALPLPQFGLRYNVADPQMRTLMASGRTISRRRFSDVPTEFSARWMLRQSEAEIFEQFYQNDAVDGSEWIEMPLVTAQGEGVHYVRFRGAYQYRRVGADLWEYSANMQMYLRPGSPEWPPGAGLRPYDGAILIGQTTTAPYVRAFKWTHAEGIGDEFPSPEGLGNVHNITFSSDRSFVFIAHSISPGVSAFRWNDETGFGERFQPGVALPSGLKTGLSLSPSEKCIAISHQSSPYVTVYHWDAETGFGAKYSNPSVSVGSNSNEVVFHPHGVALAIATQSAPYVRAYRWNDDTGFGGAYTTPVVNNNNTRGIDWHPSGNSLVVCSSSIAAPPTDSAARVLGFDVITGLSNVGSYGTFAEFEGSNFCKFSPDGRSLGTAVVSDTTQGRIFTPSGHVELSPWTGSGAGTYCSFSPDGKVFALGASSGERLALYKFDPDIGILDQYPLPITLTSTVGAIAFSGGRA